MDKKKIIKTGIEWLAYAVIFALIVWGTPHALSRILQTDYPIASITSSSMWPVLKQGDIVLIRGIDSIEEVGKGDIVVYENERGFTIHRVVEIHRDTVITKGDANNVQDAPVAVDKIIGRAIEWRGRPVRLPVLGKLSMIFK